MTKVTSYAEFQHRQGEKQLERCRRILRKATELERQLFTPHLEAFIENRKNNPGDGPEAA